MTAKTDLPAPVPGDFEPVLLLTNFMAQPPQASRGAVSAQSVPTQPLRTVWYSVSVKHRPPPLSLA